MKTLSEIRRGIERCVVDRNCVGCPYRINDNEAGCIDNVLRDALDCIDALKAGQKNKLMTYEEAVEGDAPCVYVEELGEDEVEAARVVEATGILSDTVIRMFDGELRARSDEYGLRWRCWRCNPTWEEREAAPWYRPKTEALVRANLPELCKGEDI